MVVHGSDFWKHLGESSNPAIVIDRARGSRHPKYPEFLQPLDYGYLEGISGGDGSEIDIRCGCGDRSRLTGVVCTADSVKCDAELKIITGCAAAEAETVLRAHNAGPQSAILIMNPLFTPYQEEGFSLHHR
jgi:inorganic pyrophosphatase